mgnify:CR=1 FL=1
MVYLLEDDESIRRFVIYALKQTGMEAEGFPLPSLFKEAVEHKKPDIALLDIMLPEEDGISVLKWLRSRPDTKQLPVIMLTAKTTEYDKVVGLDSGADDYIAKPFGTMELISRIKALLRRTAAADVEYTVGKLYVNKTKHIVMVDGKETELTLKEFELLCLLLRNKGIVLTRATLMDRVWGFESERENRTLDVHIRTLRVKLGEAGSYIETVRGIGYKIGGEDL